MQRTQQHTTFHIAAHAHNVMYEMFLPVLNLLYEDIVMYRDYAREYSHTLLRSSNKHCEGMRHAKIRIKKYSISLL